MKLLDIFREKRKQISVFFVYKSFEENEYLPLSFFSQKYLRWWVSIKILALFKKKTRKIKKETTRKTKTGEVNKRKDESIARVCANQNLKILNCLQSVSVEYGS